jgi:hypothetical protein
MGTRCACEASLRRTARRVLRRRTIRALTRHEAPRPNATFARNATAPRGRVQRRVVRCRNRRSASPTTHHSDHSPIRGEVPINANIGNGARSGCAMYDKIRLWPSKITSRRRSGSESRIGGSSMRPATRACSSCGRESSSAVRRFISPIARTLRVPNVSSNHHLMVNTRVRSTASSSSAHDHSRSSGIPPKTLSYCPQPR